jgi:hypothetical protein
MKSYSISANITTNFPGLRKRPYYRIIHAEYTKRLRHSGTVKTEHYVQVAAKTSQHVSEDRLKASQNPKLFKRHINEHMHTYVRFGANWWS